MNPFMILPEIEKLIKDSGVAEDLTDFYVSRSVGNMDPHKYFYDVDDAEAYQLIGSRKLYINIIAASGKKNDVDLAPNDPIMYTYTLNDCYNLMYFVYFNVDPSVVISLTADKFWANYRYGLASSTHRMMFVDSNGDVKLGLVGWSVTQIGIAPKVRRLYLEMHGDVAFNSAKSRHGNWFQVNLILVPLSKCS